MRRLSPAPIWLLAVAVAPMGACSMFGEVEVPGGTPTVDYDTCEDAEGRLAWQEARSALAQGDDRAALPLLQRAVRRCPVLVRAHLAYQDVARRLGGDEEQAMIDFYVAQQPSQGTPVPAYLRARLADTAYAQANAVDAILAEQDDFAWAHLSRGRINRGQGRLTEALLDFERAIRSDGGIVEARLERAQVLVDLGRDEEAAVAYASYLRERPADLVAMHDYATLLLYRLGRIQEAIGWLDKLEAQGDRSIALRMDRAAAMWQGKQSQAAAELYFEILEEAPTTARAALNLGMLYYEIVPQDEGGRQRFWPKARAAFRMFLSMSEPSDGHEQFERTWAVPYRLERIARRLGPAPTETPQLEMLRWPSGS
ncbi:MAG: tetratricopeptide repeat protein [Planctomycetota bacterium]